jgi:hypothetical protein
MWASQTIEPARRGQDNVTVAEAQRGKSRWAHTDERAHELRVVLGAIEATAEVLSADREHLSELQFDGLARAMAEDVRRLRALLAGCRNAPT